MAALLQISSCLGHHERGAEFPVLRSGFSSAICLIRGGAQPTPLSRFSSVICLTRSVCTCQRRSPVLIGYLFNT